MFKRKKTNTRYTHTRSDRKLHLQVSSPRIVFLQSAKVVRGVCKLVFILVVLAAGGFYGINYIQNHFLTNQEFALKHLKLETNGSLNESQVAQIAGIDPSGTIFSFDIDEAESKLAERPEIVSAEVERRLPDTIEIIVNERVPVAWLACPMLNMAGRNPLSGILLDSDGVIFKCQGNLWELARDLPVIEISTAEEHEFQLGQKMTHKDAERALALVALINEKVNDDWRVKRVAAASFYSLVVTSNDQVKATFGMYDHERQLKDLLAARQHAKETNRQLEWINLLPKHNIPGDFKESVPLSGEGLTSVND